jgi:hypothetical protein
MSARQAVRHISALMDAFEKRGRPVLGARVRPDGEIVLLTTEPAGPSLRDELDGDWADFAGETQVHGS